MIYDVSARSSGMRKVQKRLWEGFMSLSRKYNRLTPASAVEPLLHLITFSRMRTKIQQSRSDGYASIGHVPFLLN